MNIHALCVEMARHETAAVLLGAGVILVLVWLREVRECTRGNVRAPVHWANVEMWSVRRIGESYSGHADQAAWDLAELNREFGIQTPKVTSSEASEQKGPDGVNSSVTEAAHPRSPAPGAATPGGRRLPGGPTIVGYAVALAGVAAMTGLIYVVPGASRLANLSMLYLLVVIATALRFGRGSAIAASLFAFLASDWFFTRPHYTFRVHDPAEWLALAVFLVTAVVTGELTALLRAHADEARRREREAAALAEASWAVAFQMERGRALEEVLRRLADVAEVAAAAILIPVGATVSPKDGTPHFTVAASFETADGRLPSWEGAAAQEAGKVLREGRPAAWKRPGMAPGPAASALSAGEAVYVPLGVEGPVLGLLFLHLAPGALVNEAQRRAMESLTHHAAVILERERLTRSETQAKVLEEADRLKTALLSMVSHDFRSPLASIKASASALAEEGAPLDPATQHELLGVIEHETDRLNGMVGNILALSRLEADAWRPRCEATDPAELVGTALGSLTPEQNRRVRVEISPDLGEAWLDPVQMVQVLHNLVDNALKYAPEETLVEVSAQRAESSIVLEVLDCGLGLPEGEEERVFERFYRAPVLRESSVPGVGIGLAVCRGLVEAHGGTLTAHPRPGGGSIFRVEIPLPAPEPTVGERKAYARSGD